MATRKRRRPARARFKLKRLPGWGLLALGLAIGIVLTGLVQLVVERARSPESGLSTLFTRAERPEPPAQKQAAPAPSPRPKPKYDFYTILPEIETVLPERGPAAGVHADKAPVERDVRYALQAASFARFEDADRLKARLALNGLVAQIQKVTIEGRGEYHRVRLGPYESLEELDAADRQLRELGLRALRLKIKREG